MNAPAAHASLDLSGTWRLESGDGRVAAQIALPGDVHSALIAAGIIADPYLGRNELDARWVADVDWLIWREFDHAGAGSAQWYLDLDGIDTVAEVSLNGAQVLEAANCFRRYRPDVTSALRPGRNTIAMLIRSATKAANDLAEQQPFPIPWSANCPIPNGNMLRKPACHFGWDWNLAIAPLGIYGSIALKPLRHARIEHVEVAQDHHDAGSVTVAAAVTLHAAQPGTVTLVVSFAGEERRIEVSVHQGDLRHVERFTVAKPQLWWP